MKSLCEGVNVWFCCNKFSSHIQWKSYRVYVYDIHAQDSATMQPLRPYEKLDTLQQFLDYDRQVLCFYCHWDDTDRHVLSQPPFMSFV